MTTRRFMLRAGVPAAISSALYSCRQTSPAPDRSVLRIAAGPDRYNTSPGRFTFTSSRPNVHIAEAPVKANANMQAEPCLFESWKHEGGGSFLVRLRKGVQFHNGVRLDADSFLASAREFIATRDFLGIDPKSLKRVDEYTFKLRSLTASGMMINTMTHTAASAFLSYKDTATRPVGTGPYRFVRYEPKRLIEVERFDSYWGQKPRYQRISFRFMADPQARMLALRTGEVDIVSDVVPEMLAGLDPADARITLHCSRPVRYAALLCNQHGAAPFDKLKDIRIRRALALAIDRQKIAKLMYRGTAKAARGVLPGWMYGLGEETPRGFGFEPARAAEILDQAGWLMGPEGVRHKNGSALAIRLISAYPNASAVKPLPELLQQMFRAIGVRLDITEVEDGELYYSGYADQGQGDLFLELAGSGNSDPTYLLQNIFHSQAPWRFYRYIAPGKDVDTLIDAARQDSSLLAAVGRIREAHRLIIDEYIAAIPILMAPVFVLSQPDLELDMKENLDWIQFGNARLRT